MIQKRPLLLAIGLTALLVASYQNCADIRLKSPDKAIVPKETPTPSPDLPPSPPPANPPAQPAAPPKVVDGGGTSSAIDLGLSMMYSPFHWVEWTPSGHFLFTGPCSPINQAGQSGWPGGQYLFDGEGKFLSISHVCRDSGYSASCPEGQGCQLGERVSFLNKDTFIRMAQAVNTVGSQRAPMLYKISNNGLVYLGQLFQPTYETNFSTTYPVAPFINFGAVIGNTFATLEMRVKDGRVPRLDATDTYNPYHMAFYNINTTPGAQPFEHLMDYPEYSPQTIIPIHSVGPFVIATTQGKSVSSDPIKVYRFSGNQFTFIKNLVPAQSGWFGDVLKDSMDTNVFYLKPLENRNALRKFRYQNDTIDDLGLISPNVGERIVTVAGNVVVKVKNELGSTGQDIGDCAQKAEIIVEIDGKPVVMPSLTYDQNEFTNYFCQKRPTSSGCKGLALPLPIPGLQCKSEPYMNSAAIRGDGKLIIYVERITERFRILKIQ